MGIPYRGLGLLTLVGTTHDTSLLYAATRGRRVKHPCPTLMHGGSTAHHQAGTTCHIALAVILQVAEYWSLGGQRGGTGIRTAGVRGGTGEPCGGGAAGTFQMTVY